MTPPTEYIPGLLKGQWTNRFLKVGHNTKTKMGIYISTTQLWTFLLGNIPEKVFGNGHWKIVDELLPENWNWQL